MGSDMYMNPPQPVWEEYRFNNTDDAVALIGVAWDESWKVQTYFTTFGKDEEIPCWVVKIHKGEYI